MMKEQYQVPAVEELDSKLIVAGAGVGTSTEDPDDNNDEI
jgi:hypothetical protein